MKMPSRREMKRSLPGQLSGERPAPQFVVAAEDASRHADDAAQQVAGAKDAEWYRDPRNPADRAALTLCRLRRAKGGQGGWPTHGDEAVRNVLRTADREAVIWLASRAISYMDESGFPETAELYFGAEAREL